ncbi:sigma-70 family RNA polymerase sigma factor [Lysobacter sp. A6]|uniref:Sigma-70 family RNA polymerase sigma factor n=1 Tax=Noviluteimonas lactosilytica TaxID=2888523 RepID=A0ABS8JJY9_9GAMM|nr:sigma-70 family RNA polymerase sigma factor [Lysobacter lactosilyticus]
MTAAIALTLDFQASLAAHRGIVLKIAATYARSPEDRADLAQDIAMQLWQAWPGYDAARNVATWMYRVALNVAISWQRRERHRRHDALDDDAQAHLAGALDVDVEAREQLALVQRAMASLTDVDRALLLLHLEGCSHRESAEILGTTEGNVATRLNRIKSHLRREVADA